MFSLQPEGVRVVNPIERSYFYKEAASFMEYIEHRLMPRLWVFIVKIVFDL